MKKMYLIIALLAFLGFAAFGDTDEQEEIDFLLFFPNSSDRFVNENQAMIQLDNLAKYLTGRNLASGQIYVYGYAAAALNNIEPVNLSRDRALFVINELQKRGVPKDLFSDPVGHGSVDLWGSNINEEGRSPNRRVRILLDGNLLTPQIVKAADTEIKISSNDEAARNINIPAKPRADFPWKYLLLLLVLAIILAIILFASKKRKSSAGNTALEQPLISPLITAAAPPAAVPVTVVPVAAGEIIVNLEEEIRLRAYHLYEQRNGQNGNADGDWYIAVPEICAKYEADGYQTYPEAGSWWARKS